MTSQTLAASDATRTGTDARDPEATLERALSALDGDHLRQAISSLVSRMPNMLIHGAKDGLDAFEGMESEEAISSIGMLLANSFAPALARDEDAMTVRYASCVPGAPAETWEVEVVRTAPAVGELEAGTGEAGDRHADLPHVHPLHAMAEAMDTAAVADALVRHAARLDGVYFYPSRIAARDDLGRPHVGAGRLDVRRLVSVLIAARGTLHTRLGIGDGARISIEGASRKDVETGSFVVHIRRVA